MNKKKFAAIILPIVLFATMNSLAATYFVSVKGSDTNSGGESDPFKTIQKAAGLMVAGDVCTIRAGVYRETVMPVNSGTAAAPIKFMAYPGEYVEVNGCDVVTGWNQYKDFIYSATFSSKVTQVFANGRMVNQAQYPDKSLNYLDNDDLADVTVSANYTATLDGANFANDVLKNAVFVALCGTKWVTVNGKVSSNSGNSITATNTSNMWNGSSNDIYLGKGKGFITGSLALLDNANEWFYGSGRLYLALPNKANPANALIEARVRVYSFSVVNKSNIEISGIHSKAATIYLNNSTNCIIDGCSVRYPVPFFTTKQEFNRDSHNPADWTGIGVAISGKGNVIKNSYVAHSWGDGITVWGENNHVENCLVEDCNWLAVDCAPITTSGKGHLISHNTLRHTTRSGLVHRYLGNGIIEYNNIYRCGTICTDLGATYSFYTNGKGTEIRYNWVHDNLSKGVSTGIYLDNGDSSYVVHHNVIWNCKEGIRLNTPSVNHQVYNNTIWYIDQAMPVWEANGVVQQNVKVWNNLSSKSDFKGTELKKNLSIADAKFTSVENFDFSLTSSSPAIDFGLPIAGITDGFLGNAPDAGAYEFGSSWKAGATGLNFSFQDETPQPAWDLGATPLSPTSVKLSWTDNSDNETGFQVERRLDKETKFSIIKTTAAGETSYTDESLASSSIYFYRVLSINDYGSSMYSNEVKVQTPGDGKSVLLEAELYSEMKGIINNQHSIGGCDNGDWINFKDVELVSTVDQVTIKYGVPQQYAGQKVEFRLDSQTGQLLGTFTTESTGGWDTWVEKTQAITPFSGKHTIYVLFKGGSGVGNFDWFYFKNSNPTAIETLEYSAPSFELFPNPGKDQINVKLKGFSQKTRITIFALTGNVIQQTENSGNSFQIPLNPAIKSGCYLIQISEPQKLVTKKLLIE